MTQPKTPPAGKSPPPTTKLRVRQKFGKYQILGKLGAGGFATVYRARDTIEGLQVALKVPHPHMVGQSMLEAVRREVRLSAQLDHHNILPIKNAAFIDGVFCIAYPMGQGTLDERLQKRLGRTKAVSYLSQILEAVAYAHEHGVIHCDLKPDNLLLFDADRIRLIDFGIAKLATKTLVASGSGTVGYMAPEQAMGHPSKRSDVFSIGLIACRLLLGITPSWPFTWPPPDLARSRYLDAEVMAFLERACHINDRLRFRDAGQMLGAWKRLRSRLLADGKASVKREPRQRTDWRTVRRRQFVQEFGRALGLSDNCSRCQGPVSEPMRACPWCGTARERYPGETRMPSRCGRCRRGRKLDWRFCPWCHGPGFTEVATREYQDKAYSARCANAACERKQLMPFMRYCPWCRRKVRRAWRFEGANGRCGSCSWGVNTDYWSHCPWCTSAL